MSADPFQNSTTVKNILQHIISPKVIGDGGSGYIVRTDLVHIHNLIFASGTATEDGTTSHPYTTQCGTATILNGTAATTVYHSRITANSVIMMSVQSGSTTYSTRVTPNLGSFTITMSSSVPTATTVGWFIASF